MDQNEFFRILAGMHWDYILGFMLLMFVVSLIRYGIFTGTIHYLCAVLMRDRWARYRVQRPFVSREKMRKEIKWSLIASLIFGFMETLMVVCNYFGLTSLYANISDMGWGYFFGSIFLMVCIHDTYFYWTHRLLHWKPLFKRIHRVHHESTSTTAFTAYSFHPVEAAVTFAVIPLISFIMPVHWLSLAIFMAIMSGWSVIQHNSYEFWPRWVVKNKFLNIPCTPTHHNVHHKRVHKNLSLYFTFWDRLLGTMDPEYEAIFDKVKDQAQERTASMSNVYAGHPVQGQTKAV